MKVRPTRMQCRVSSKIGNIDTSDRLPNVSPKTKNIHNAFDYEREKKKLHEKQSRSVRFEVAHVLRQKTFTTTFSWLFVGRTKTKSDVVDVVGRWRCGKKT